MKLLGLFLIALSPLIVLAFEGGGKDFSAHKQHMLSEMDKRISMMQEKRNCLSSAQSHEDAKKCHESAMQKEKEFKVNHLEKQKQMIEEQLKNAKK